MLQIQQSLISATNGMSLFCFDKKGFYCISVVKYNVYNLIYLAHALEECGTAPIKPAHKLALFMGVVITPRLIR